MKEFFKYHLPKVFLLICSCSFAITSTINAQQREIYTLKDGWKFFKGDNKQAYQIDFNDSKWQSVTVPHDWAIFGPFDKEIDKQTVKIVQNNEKVATEKTGRTGSLPFVGVGWYRKTFTIDNLTPGRKAILPSMGQ